MASPNPYSPPKSGVEDAARGRLVAERPRQVVHATALLWLSLVFALVAFFLESRRNPDDWATDLISLAIVLAISLTVNIALWRGRNWSRWLTLVFTALSFLIVPTWFVEPTALPPLELTFNGIAVVLDLVVLYLVFTEPGSLFFRYARDGFQS
jgi:hypothetical protein